MLDDIRVEPADEREDRQGEKTEESEYIEERAESSSPSSLTDKQRGERKQDHNNIFSYFLQYVELFTISFY